jgi:hypothetical protein
MPQILSQELKKALEAVSRPTFEGLGWVGGCGKEIDFLHKQPIEKMLPLCKDLLYGRISKYNLTTWDRSEDIAIACYQVSAAILLRDMKKPEALNLLREWLSSQTIHPEKQKFYAHEIGGLQQVISSIGSYGQAEDIPRLQKWINHPDVSIRLELTRALGNINHKSAIETLHKMMLNDPENSVRVEAIISLRNYGDQSVLADLKSIYDNPHYLNHPNEKKVIKETIDAIEKRLKDQTVKHD